jgi:hypothetical protein
VMGEGKESSWNKRKDGAHFLIDDLQVSNQSVSPTPKGSVTNCIRFQWQWLNASSWLRSSNQSLVPALLQLGQSTGISSDPPTTAHKSNIF